jgi:hypothetical protein
MSDLKRTSDEIASQRNVGIGPHLARVISILDKTFMGRLEVSLLREQGNILAQGQQTFLVDCALPFFGSTNYEFTGKNTSESNGSFAGFNDAQKSYGMWFVPPDVGVTVMVVFINGKADRGYWIACVPDRFANHSVPAISGSTFVDIFSSDKAKYDTDMPLPVAEFNKKGNEDNKDINIDRLKRPVHPVVETYYRQGLLEDSVRGVVSSSPRRDLPSNVYGISTPGPLDRRPGAKKAVIGKIDDKTQAPVPVSRLGGTQIVMDDGDDNFQRKQSAGKLPYKEAYAKTNEGDPEIPADEYFRIRTRTGHQILFHNSEDLIYLTNAQGSAWIELTSNGKIDIYSLDSISIHTENDLNIKADRDINIEAGRNINMKTTAEYRSPQSLNQPPAFTDAEGNETGRIQIESQNNFNLLIGKNGKIQARNPKKEFGNLDIAVMGDMRVTVRDPNIADGFSGITETPGTIPTDILTETRNIKGLHIRSFDQIKMFSQEDFNIRTDKNTLIYSKKDTNILSDGWHVETAKQIHMNGPNALKADESLGSLKIQQLSVYVNPKNNNKLEWKGIRYKDADVKSIMKRIPMHEPWPNHENLKPEDSNKSKTDREKKL